MSKSPKLILANLFTEAQQRDSWEPLYIYQILIGTSHSVSDSTSYIFFPQVLFAGAFFRRRFRQDSWRNEIDIRSYSPTCRAVFVSVTGPGAPPAALRLLPQLFILSVMRLSYFRRFYGPTLMLFLFLNSNWMELPKKRWSR